VKLKRSLSIFLLVLFLGNTLLKSALIIHYLQNVREITENCCINKNKPELQCYGKCFINSQLNRIDQHSKKELPARMVLSDFELYVLPSNTNVKGQFALFQAYVPYYKDTYDFDFASFIFQPPTA
jgi:hypothetical protein